VTNLADPLERLSPAVRSRLERFSAALERIHIDDLPIYAVRPGQPEHRRAVEAAAILATDARLAEAIAAARAAVIEYVARQYAASSIRFNYGGEVVPSLGPTDDRVRVMRSLGDAVSALVLWERLDEADRAELLGPWARLLR
jgi:hypothetical protein